MTINSNDVWDWTRCRSGLARAMVVVLAAVWLGLSSPHAAQLNSVLTIGVFFEQVRGLIADIDRRAASLLHEGNNAIAQQQMLLAGLLRGTLQEMEKAYSRQLEQTIDGLANLEKDAFTNLQLSIERLERLEQATAADLNAVTRQLHSATTELLSRVSLSNRYPVIHGLLTRDVLADFDQRPDDIQVLGFFLVDRDLNKAPEIRVNDVLIEPRYISAVFDRIQVQLPDSLKSQLQFDNSPCDPRRTFKIDIKTFYYRRSGVWPLAWKQKASIQQTLNAIPGEVQYQTAVYKTGELVAESDIEELFRIESPNFNWSCEENASNHADYRIPAGATVIEKHAGWADLGGRWENHGCSVSEAGDMIVGQCHVRGGNRGLFDCPGGGHGRVAVWGKIRRKVQNKTEFTNELVRSFVIAGGEASGIVDLPTGQRLNAIRVEVRRANKRGHCPDLADESIVNLQPGSNQTLRATSKNGLFEVVTDGRQVFIRRVSK